MKKTMLKIAETFRPYLQLAIRLWIGGLFIMSGVAKLQNFKAFERAALSYDVLPEMLTKIYAIMLPWVEILAGGYLILGLFTHFAALLVILMMVSFIIAIAAVLLRGDSLENCGCFVGGKSEPLTPKKLIEDFVLLGVSVYLFVTRPGKWSLDNLLRKKKDPSRNPEESQDGSSSI